MAAAVAVGVGAVWEWCMQVVLVCMLARWVVRGEAQSQVVVVCISGGRGRGCRCVYGVRWHSSGQKDGRVLCCWRWCWWWWWCWRDAACNAFVCFHTSASRACASPRRKRASGIGESSRPPPAKLYLRSSAAYSFAATLNVYICIVYIIHIPVHLFVFLAIKLLYLVAGHG